MICLCGYRLEDSGATAENAAIRVRASSRPLFDVPGVFEAREMLRKKVLGREVNVSIDYVLAKSDQNNMPERLCCTVLFGNTCVAFSFTFTFLHSLSTVVGFSIITVLLVISTIVLMTITFFRIFFNPTRLKGIFKNNK